jgi:hypothetical protein
MVLASGIEYVTVPIMVKKGLQAICGYLNASKKNVQNMMINLSDAFYT